LAVHEKHSSATTTQIGSAECAPNQRAVAGGK
jgi:hypothetical protein